MLRQRVPAMCVIPAALLLAVASGDAAPEPSIAPVSWTLDFTYDDPQRLVMPPVGEARPQVFWYMPYTVENNTGRDVEFYPRFEIMAGATQILVDQEDIPSNVFAAIKRRYAATRPFLMSPTRIIGTLHQGRDYAKDGVAIWRQFNVEANEFTVFVRGLSGETARVLNAAFDPSAPETAEVPLADGTSVPEVVNPRYFTLHKTLAISYHLPGDIETRIEARPVRAGQKWIMR